MAEVPLRADLDERVEHLGGARRAVVREHRRAAGRPGDHDLEDPAVTGGNRDHVDVPGAHGANL